MIAVLVGLLLSLDKNEWFVAITFGVLIDADHLFALSRYVTENGWEAILSPTWDDGSGLPWRSWFHYPIGAAIVAPLAIGWRFLIPLLFWSIHVGTDYLQSAMLGHSTLIESAAFALACAGILSFGYIRWRETHESGSLHGYITYVRRSIVGSVTRLGRPLSPPRDST